MEEHPSERITEVDDPFRSSSDTVGSTLQSLEGLTFGNADDPAKEPLPDGVPHKPQSIPPLPLPKDDKFLSRGAATARTRSSSPRKEKNVTAQEWNEKEDYSYIRGQGKKNAFDAEFDEKARVDDENSEESKGEITSIITQFEGDKIADLGSPTREHPIFQYPARSSSLDALSSPPGPSNEASGSVLSPTTSTKEGDRASISYAASIRSQHPPEPDPEPDLPFDFHRFLEQLRHRTADPVARFLRSFLQEFGKKQWQVHEQVKIIGDFLTFITNRMAQCDIWRNVSEAEFDNAKEGMEKLVMNRLYTQTFSPEIPAGEPSPVKGRRKGTPARLGIGRKGQHQEDVEKDEVLAQKMRIYGWIKEEHLDIKPFNDKGRKFLQLAQQELVKIKSYRAPRDKVICVLNCCKVIFGFLKNAESDQSADAFIPLLIYTVLKARPDHIFSNVQYILRFRSPDKLNGETGYYMSSLMGAVQFIETLDRTNLTVSDAEFETAVEAAVSEIASRNEREEKRVQLNPPPPPQSRPSSRSMSQLALTIGHSALDRPEVTALNSSDGERARNISDEHSGDERAAVSGLLRTIQRPLSTIGRIFSEDASTTLSTGTGAGRPPLTPQPSTAPQRASAATTPVPSSDAPPGAAALAGRDRVAAEDAAAMQASAETAEAHRVMEAEHRTVVETLAGMFPDLDREIIGDVVRIKEGRIGQAVDACLALSR